MPNYSVALGAQPPQFDVSGALALAGQMQRDKLAALQMQHSMRNDDARLRLAQDAAAQNRQAAAMRLSEVQGQRNALAEYNKANQAGDANALSKLSAYPEIQQQVLSVRNQMGEADRQAFDQRLLRNARRAQYVAGFEGDAKTQAWQQALKEAADTGDISPEMYQQYSASPPNDLMLHNVISQAVPIQQLYAAEAPTPQMRELEAAGIKPGSEEYRNIVAPKALPKFEKVGNRLIRINPDGTTADMTPPGIALEDAPKDYRWAIDPNSGQTALDETGRPIAEPIPGGPATKIPGEQAAKLAAMQTAEQSFQDAQAFFENMGYMGDRVNKVLNRGDAGRAERTIRLAVESALRAMTGAAAPEHEVDQYMDLFGPSVFDTPATITDKLNRLKSFITNMKANLSQGRGPAFSSGADAGAERSTPDFGGMSNEDILRELGEQ